jgi:outer membrane protein assembly factor BamB
VRRVDPATNRVTAVVHGLLGPLGFGFQGSKVYVALHHGQAIAELDGATGRIVRRYPVPSPGGGVTASRPGSVTLAYGAIWTGVSNLDGVVRIDPASGATRVPRFGEPCGGTFAALAGGLWVACDRHVIRIDPATGAVEARVALSGDIAVLDGRLWIAAQPGRVLGLDPRTGAVVATVRYPGAYWADNGILAADGHLWTWDANRSLIQELAVTS